MHDIFTPKPIQTEELLHLVQDYAIYSLLVSQLMPTRHHSWWLRWTCWSIKGWDHFLKGVHPDWWENRQEEHIQATVWISCLRKIKIPNVGLRDISSSALRHGFLTVSLPTWALVSIIPSKCSLIAHSDNAIRANHRTLQCYSGQVNWCDPLQSNLTLHIR